LSTAETKVSYFSKVFEKSNRVLLADSRLKVFIDSKHRLFLSNPNQYPESTVCQVCRRLMLRIPVRKLSNLKNPVKAVGAQSHLGTSSAHQQRKTGETDRPEGPKKRSKK
jgi:hypothetical protein